VEVNKIVQELDREIAMLQQARALLSGSSSARPAKAAPAPGRRRKHHLSPEGRRRISEALKRRWAKRRKAAAVKSAKSTKPAKAA